MFADWSRERQIRHRRFYYDAPVIPVDEAAKLARVQLNVYGAEIVVETAWQEVLEAVRLDFAWFDQGEPPTRKADVNIVIERGPPDYDALGETIASFVTPRNVVYQDAGSTVVDYFGRALSVRDRSTGALTVKGEDLYIVHEAVYQFLVSWLGKHLEDLGLPRLHGLGLSGRQGGVVVMLPSGGGKTTLALRGLRDGDVKLLSEDSPLIDRRGRLHPFPLRIGVNATDAEKLPPGHVRRIERMELHPKFALEIAAFENRIERHPQPLTHLVIGRRSLGSRATLEPLPRRAAVPMLFREAVVGVGIYQGMEWLLQHGMRDVVRQAHPALTRSRCCLAGLMHAKVWRMTFGRDHERNWSTLHQLLD